MSAFDQTTYDRNQDLTTAPSAAAAAAVLSPLSISESDQWFLSRNDESFARNRGDLQKEEAKESSKAKVVMERKLTHKEIERQRRIEMTNLCGSLRTLLPLQYIKGKRSMSDQLQGAVNYIKDMENNISEIKSRRDKLLKKSSSSSAKCYREDTVTVKPCLNGFEILIDTRYHESDQVSPLSRILKELISRGLGKVVNCVSTRADDGGRFLHTIQMEARNCIVEDLSRLEGRLTHLVNCPISDVN